MKGSPLQKSKKFRTKKTNVSETKGKKDSTPKIDRIKSFAQKLGQKCKKLFFVRKRKLIPFFFFLDVIAVLLIIHFISLTNQDSLYDSSSVMGVRNETYPLFLQQGGELDVSSLSYIIYEPESRVTVVEKNSHFRFAPASTAKIVTALIALESYGQEDVLEAKNLSSVIGSKMGLFEGEKISVKNLLYGLMLPSGNDAAFILAHNYPTGYVGFVQRMNDIVSNELYLKNTHFVDPAGLDDRNYTTAYDLARIASRAMQNATFRNIVKTRSIMVTNEDGSIIHELENLNELLALENVTGVKTGFTEEAQGVLVTSARVKQKEFVIVVLKSKDRFFDTRTLMSKILDAVEVVKY